MTDPQSAHKEATENGVSGQTTRPLRPESAIAAEVLADDSRWGFIDPHGAKAAAIREEAARDD